MLTFVHRCAVWAFVIFVGSGGPSSSGAAGLAIKHAGLNPPIHLINHVQPHECGVKSASFARICRPNAYATCLRAAGRGVEGYSPPFCARRQTACRGCLDKLRDCITHIGHAPRSEFSCDECSGKFSRCIGKRYPKLKD